MKKLALAVSLALLFVLLTSASSFAQMDMAKDCKKVIKVMGDEMMYREAFGKHSGEMGHQMGCGSMGSGMMHQMGCGGMMGCGDKMGCCQKDFFICCKKELELTDKQVEDLKSIKMEFLKGSFKAEANLKIAKLELKSVMHEEDASLKDIEAKLKSVANIETDMKLSHIKAFRQAKALLTPEQMEKLKKGEGM